MKIFPLKVVNSLIKFEQLIAAFLVFFFQKKMRDLFFGACPLFLFVLFYFCMSNPADNKDKPRKYTKGFLMEIVNFYRFFWKISKNKKKIVFYAEHADYYTYFEGLIKEISTEHSQVLCYITSDPDDPILQRTDPRIRTFYLNKLLPFFFAFVKCKVLVMTMTDLNQFHLKRSANPVHYVYVFHSSVSTHMIYRHGAFDYYDSILCCGPHHIKEIRRYEELNKMPAKKLIEAGYYRLERIYDAYKKYEPENISTKITILIAPSWGIDNILESCGESLVGILLNADYTVIVRPHPETVKRFPNIINLFSSKFGANPNFILETSVATDDSLLRANILISDYSGVALEYAFGTERPVLFLDVPKKIRNEGFEKLDIEPLELFLRSKIGVVVSPEKLESIPQVISKLLAEKADYKQRIIELRRKYIYNFGHSSEIGVQYIIDIARDKNIN